MPTTRTGFLLVLLAGSVVSIMVVLTTHLGNLFSIKGNIILKNCNFLFFFSPFKPDSSNTLGFGILSLKPLSPFATWLLVGNQAAYLPDLDISLLLLFIPFL